MGKTRLEREAEFKAKIAELDEYVKKMNAKEHLTDEEVDQRHAVNQQVSEGYGRFRAGDV